MNKKIFNISLYFMFLVLSCKNEYNNIDIKPNNHNSPKTFKEIIEKSRWCVSNNDINCYKDLYQINSQGTVITIENMFKSELKSFNGKHNKIWPREWKMKEIININDSISLVLGYYKLGGKKYPDSYPFVGKNEHRKLWLNDINSDRDFEIFMKCGALTVQYEKEIN